MRAFGATVLLTGLLAGTALADAPSVSILPQARPAGAVDAGSETALSPAQSLRPQARPGLKITTVNTAPTGPTMSFLAPAEPTAIRASLMNARLKPKSRPEATEAPERVIQAAVVRTLPGRALTESRRGSVCGDASIRGEEISPIVSRVRGCGIADPVKVTQIDGVRLSMPATIDCTTARALKSWINRGLRPVAPAEIVRLNIAGSYVCRPRNNVRGAQVSEHGRGKAVDISGITLANGRTITVSQDWRREKMLRASYSRACGIFGTTLGPGSDGYHEDHMHFDTANANRPYCG